MSKHSAIMFIAPCTSSLFASARSGSRLSPATISRSGGCPRGISLVSTRRKSASPTSMLTVRRNTRSISKLFSSHTKNFSGELTGRPSSLARLSSRRARSSSSPEPDDLPPVALGWSAEWKRFELSDRPAFVGEFLAQLPARLGFAIESLRHGSRAARLSYKQDLNLKVPTLIGNFQHVPDANVARRLGGLSIRFDAAEVTCPFRKRTRLEKSRRPEPSVHAHAIHNGVRTIRAGSSGSPDD